MVSIKKSPNHVPGKGFGQFNQFGALFKPFNKPVRNPASPAWAPVKRPGQNSTSLILPAAVDGMEHGGFEIVPGIGLQDNSWPAVCDKSHKASRRQWTLSRRAQCEWLGSWAAAAIKRASAMHLAKRIGLPGVDRDHRVGVEGISTDHCVKGQGAAMNMGHEFLG